MKNKRILLTFILPLVFMLLSAFSSPQETELKVADSATVKFQMNVKFQKPNIGVTINDARNSDSFVRLLDKYQENNSEVAEAIRETNAYTKYRIETQERRYKESTLDQLSRDTGYSIDAINSFISKMRLRRVISSVVLMTFLILSYIMIVFESHKKGGLEWKYLLTKILFLSILSGAMYFVIAQFMQGAFNPELQRFYELLKLSG